MEFLTYAGGHTDWSTGGGITMKKIKAHIHWRNIQSKWDKPFMHNAIEHKHIFSQLWILTPSYFYCYFPCDEDANCSPPPTTVLVTTLVVTLKSLGKMNHCIIGFYTMITQRLLRVERAYAAPNPILFYSNGTLRLYENENQNPI